MGTIHSETEFSKRLAALRKRKGKSAKVLSQLCGLTDGAIRKYGPGRHFPPRLLPLGLMCEAGKVSKASSISLRYLGANTMRYSHR